MLFSTGHTICIYKLSMKHTKFTVPHQDYVERLTKPRRTKVKDQSELQHGLAESSRSARLDTINRAMDIQQILFEISQITNNYYGFQILVVIATAFVVIVFDFYNMLDMISNRHTKEFRLSFSNGMLMLGSGILINLGNILAMVVVCSLLESATTRMGMIVHKTLVVSSCPDIRERLTQFAMQLKETNPKFDAMGLFNIDATLVYSMAGAITTYLIILLQYTSKESANHKHNINGTHSHQH